MSVYSMTGFASVKRTVGAAGLSARIGLEVKSVNSRFLDATLRLSDELRALEMPLREKLAHRIKRGKVELRAWVERDETGAVPQPSAQALQRLAQVQDQVRVWLPDAASLSVSDAMRLASANPHAGSTVTPEEVLAAADELLSDFTAAREREGARLADMISERLRALRTLADQCEPLVPQAVAQARDRFVQRFTQALEQAGAPVTSQAAQERALTEASAYAIRVDVAEELSRLRGHLSEVADQLKRGGDLGKRLDFLVQELHREANTLGAKSPVLEMSRMSVDMKVLIEQIREQVQNIE